MHPSSDPVEDMEVESEEQGAIRYEDIYIPPLPATAFVANEDGSRLIITHIVNKNFKSYADVQELGPFHKYFTAIIGPNGSGKSNVIDSMLFVFGYHAKRLRSKKISALLHDSANHGKASSCTVTVHFALMIDNPDDPEKYQTVPDSAFYISRTANADNSSHYTINGKRAQFKEIGKLLRSHGIDLDHNRFLILQGEVEQISLMKPRAENPNETGMLEYLEDIIGSSRFKIPIEQMIVKVEERSKIREEKVARCKVYQNELDQLKGPYSTAMKYVELENSIIECKHKLLQKKIVMGEKDQEEKKLTLQKFEEEVKNLKKKMLEKQKAIQEIEKNNSEKTRELERISSLKDKAKAAFEANKLNDVALQSEIENVNKKRKETAKLLTAEEEKKHKLEKIPGKNREEIAELEQLEPKLEEERKSAEAKHAEIMATLQTDTQGLQDEKEKLQIELVELKKIQDTTKSKYDISKTQLELYASQEENEKKKLDTMKQRLDETIKDLKKKETELNNITKKIPEIENKLQESQEELESIRVEEQNISTQRRRHQLQLEESRSSMQATRGRGRVIDSLMEQKAAGNIPGIFGRMGDLGAIDEKYDIAISTACGPLDNIVVDTVDTASECINYLKRNNIGSATFVALDKQEKFRQMYSQPFQAPEGIPRLFDLIKVADERVRPVFYYALQDTLVANNLDQATRIAYGKRRYRVVTLTGDVIEIAGTMSGGGGRPSKGRMGRKVEQATETVSPREIERMEKTLETMNTKLNSLRQRMNSLEENIATYQNELRTLVQQKNRLNIEVKGLREQEPMLKQQIKAQEGKLKESACDANKMKQLNKTVTEAKQEYDRATEAASVIEKQVNKLHAEIIAKTKGRLETAQKKLDEATAKLDKVKKEKTKLRVAITTAERNVKKSEEKIENMKKEIKNCEERIKNCAKDIKENEVKAKETLEEFQKYEEELKELEENNADTKSEIDKLKKDENKLKSEEIDLKKEYQTAKSELEHRIAKLQSDKKQLQTLKLSEESQATENKMELKMLTAEELESIDVDDLKETIKTKEGNMPKTKPNLSVIQEYNRKVEIYIEKAKDAEAATEARNRTREMLELLKKRRVVEFMKGFNIISIKVKECYQMLAEGGDAELELVNSIDPFLDGIRFTVRPPKKSWKEIQFLSGGEKTLSSLSLIFALHFYKPTPLYFMDEIDAALDWKNTAIVGYYLKEKTRDAQFIIVSLRENMFELADQLVGIYKTDNCTKSVSIVPRHYTIQEAETSS